MRIFSHQFRTYLKCVKRMNIPFQLSKLQHEDKHSLILIRYLALTLALSLPTTPYFFRTSLQVQMTRPTMALLISPP